MRNRKKPSHELRSLPSRRDFLHVQSHKKSCATASFILQIAPQKPVQASPKGSSQAPYQETTAKTTSYGVTVSKRVDKRAVVRNQIKRRLRSLANDVILQYGHPDYDYVLIGRAAAKDRPYDKLINDLRYCLHQLNLFQKER